MGYYHINDLSTAKDCIEKGYKIQTNTTVNRFLALHQYYLGLVYHDLEKLSESKGCLEKALELSVEYKERNIEGITRCLIGRIIGKISSKKINEAEKYIRQGIKMLEQLKTAPDVANGYFFLGELYANTNRNDEAFVNLNKALSMCQEMGIGYWPDRIQEVLARL